MYQSKAIKCRDCGQEFMVSAEEHEFYAENGIPLPERCVICQTTRKNECNRNGERRPAQAMHDVFCADCGKRLQVYHVPKFDRPVYCIDCIRVHSDRL